MKGALLRRKNWLLKTVQPKLDVLRRHISEKRWPPEFVEKMSLFTEKIEQLGIHEGETMATNEQLESITIADAGLTTRSYNCVRRAGLKTMADVAKKVYEGNNTIRDGWNVKTTGLFGIFQLGKKSALEIINKLDEYGIDGSWAKSEYGLEGM